MRHPKLSIKFSLIVVVFLVLGMVSCNSSQKKQVTDSAENAKPFFKLSLAQWSFHRQIINGEMSPLDFARKASELGFEGIEYVSGL